MQVEVKVCFHGLLTKNSQQGNFESTLTVNETLEKALKEISSALGLEANDFAQYVMLVNGKAIVTSTRKVKLRKGDSLVFVPITSGG